MQLDAEACYLAAKANDRRFDGVFFIGVSSTRIYCRPICPVKMPKQENCSYYHTAAAAERAGYRPCLRCRPELAPGLAPVDSVHRLAYEAFHRIQDGALSEMSVDALAEELGVSGRHLRRAVEQQYGVSPIELAQTQRLLLAKRLLTDTDLPVGEIAMASGFESLRRFNALFKDRYRLNPTSLRKESKGKGRDSLACELGYRTPFDWASLLGFLSSRTIAGVEAVGGQRYSRTVHLGEHRGWISIQNDAERSVLRVGVSPSLAHKLPPVLARVKRLFDLHCDPAPISAHLGELAAKHAGLRVPGAFDAFELAVRAVLGQQVSVAGARTLAGRLTSRFGSPIETPVPELTHTFPKPAVIADLDPADVAQIGLPTKRAQTIVEIARFARDVGFRHKPDVLIAKLKELPGIGEWTAQYVAMRALGWPDAFLSGDLGIQKALGERNAKKIEAISEQWRPWRAYAGMHLWKSLEKDND